MKVTCNRAKLAESLGLVSNIAAQKSTRPILQCLRMQAEDGVDSRLTLSATDLELGIRCEIKEVEVSEPGQAVINAHKLYEIIREVTHETVAFELKEDNLAIVTGSGNFKLYTFEPDEFPPVAPKESGEGVRVQSADLVNLAALTVYAAARETTRYAINGLLLDVEGSKVTMVGTDGRRLACASATLLEKSAEPVSCILPTRAVQMLSRLSPAEDGEMKVMVSESQAVFDLAGIQLISAIIEGKFPSYSSVIPKESTCKITADRVVLLGALRQAAVLASEDSHGVKVTVSSNKLAIESHSAEQGEAAIEAPVETNGNELQIAFNPNYLIEALRVLTTEQVILELKEPKTPLVMKSGTNFTYVLMPVTI